jgi:hypothetical protein
MSTHLSLPTHHATFSRTPELNVFFFAVLLNLPWEFMQVPLFEGVAQMPHWQGVKLCGLAALGDGFISLIAYWVVAATAKNRLWIIAPKSRQIALLVAISVGFTVLIEWLVLRGDWWISWRYTAAMPLLPGLGIGLMPILQWLVLPPLLVAIVRRQLGGSAT